MMLIFQNIEEIEARIFKGGQSKVEMLHFILNMKEKIESEGGPAFLKAKNIEEM